MEKLKDGTEIAFDYYKVTYKEVNAFLNEKKKKDEDVFAMMGRVSGKDASFFESLPWADWRKVAKAFWEGIYDPNAEDTSVKGSTGVSSTEGSPQSS